MHDGARLAALKTRLLPDLRIARGRSAQLDGARALGIAQIPVQAVQPRRAGGGQLVDETAFSAGDGDRHRPRVFQEVLQVRARREVANDFACRAAACCCRIDRRTTAASASSATAAPALRTATRRTSLCSAAASRSARAATPASIRRAACRCFTAATKATTAKSAKANRRARKTRRARNQPIGRARFKQRRHGVVHFRPRFLNRRQVVEDVKAAPRRADHQVVVRRLNLDP